MLLVLTCEQIESILANESHLDLCIYGLSFYS